MSDNDHGINRLVEFLKNTPRAKLSDFPDYAQPYLSGYFPPETRMIAPEPEAVIAMAIDDARRQPQTSPPPVPSFYERDTIRDIGSHSVDPEFKNVVFRLLTALEHVEAAFEKEQTVRQLVGKERDTLRDQLGVLWTIISNIRVPIQKCFIDRTMPFAEFWEIASRWSESVTGEGHHDYLAKRLKDLEGILRKCDNALTARTCEHGLREEIAALLREERPIKA